MRTFNLVDRFEVVAASVPDRTAPAVRSKPDDRWAGQIAGGDE